MKYKNIKEALFVSRPNRFIAHISIDGNEEIAHVKNTGRCKELLIPGARLFVEECDTSTRKTKYDVISVYKKNTLINMDSQVPNKVFEEWAQQNFLSGITYIKREVKYKNSRFDFYLERGEQKIFVEIKGVTLEENSVAMFPDAPTLRGLKHVQELCDCLKEGYSAYIIFIIQMKGIKYFTPNKKTHMDFAQALMQSEKSGVNILAYDCDVSYDEITMGERVEIVL